MKPQENLLHWQAINCKIIYLSIHVFAKWQKMLRGEIAENRDQFWSV